jgi:hypothetical protein
LYERASDSKFGFFTQNKELKSLARKVQLQLQLMPHFFTRFPSKLGAISLLRDERFYFLLVPNLLPCCQLQQRDCLHLAIAFSFVVIEVLIPVGCRCQRRGSEFHR